MPGATLTGVVLTYHIVSDVPEPSTLALLGVGALGLLARLTLAAEAERGEPRTFPSPAVVLAGLFGEGRRKARPVPNTK